MDSSRKIPKVTPEPALMAPKSGDLGIPQNQGFPNLPNLPNLYFPNGPCFLDSISRPQIFQSYQVTKGQQKNHPGAACDPMDPEMGQVAIRCLKKK